jgi:hypothetical protein
MFDSDYDRKIKYPAELNDIAKKIADGEPSITWDDILDFFIALEKEEKKITDERKKSKKTKNRKCSFFKKHA